MKHFPSGTPAAVLCGWILLAGTAGAQGAPDSFEPFLNAHDLREVVASGNVLWFATNGGAQRFDIASATWTSFPRRRTGGPVGNDLSTVTVAGTGLLWFGSNDQGVSTYDPSRDLWERFEEIPDPRVRVIRASGQEVGIGTQAGLAHRSRPGRTVVCNEIDRGCIVPSFVIRDFAWTGDTLWVATQSGLGRFNGATWDPETSLPEGSLGTDIPSLAVFEGTLWAVIGNSVRRLDPSGWTATGINGQKLVVAGGRLFAIGGSQVRVRRDDVWDVVETGTTLPIRDLEVVGGSYYFATPSGLVVTPVNGGGASVTRYPPGPPIPDFHRGAAVDRDGIVWFGNQEGLLRYDGEAWSAFYRGESGLGSGWTFGLAVVGDDLAVGNCCCDSPPACPFNIRRDGGFATLDVHDVWAMDVDDRGRLWVGTDDDGALLLERGDDGVWDVVLEITNAVTNGALRANQIRAIAVTPQGTYFGHEFGPGVDFWPHGGNPEAGFDPGSWSHFSVSSGLRDGSVAFMRASGNDVWVGTSTGLHRISSGVIIENYTTSFSREIPGDLPRVVRTITLDGGRNVWAGTNRGVLLLQRGSGELRLFDTSVSNLTDDDVLSSAWDPIDGSIWLGTALGITRIDPEGVLGASPPASSFVIYPNPRRIRTTADQKVSIGISRFGGPPLPAGNELMGAEVFDLRGRRVGAFRLSSNEWNWDVTNENGAAVAPGLYVVRGRTASGEALELKLGILR